MRKTKDARIAMERLAAALGWEIHTEGGVWFVDSPAHARDLSFDARGLLCTMTRVALAPLKWQGEGLTVEELRDLIRFVPDHISHPKKGVYLDLPFKTPSTVEATMYRAFFQPELVT